MSKFVPKTTAVVMAMEKKPGLDKFGINVGRLNPEEETHRQYIQQHLTFHDRESYFKWRSQWRGAYRADSQAIRLLRTKMWVPGGDSDAQARRAQMRNMAYNLMVLRAASKKVAQQQYERSLT